MDSTIKTTVCEELHQAPSSVNGTVPVIGVEPNCLQGLPSARKSVIFGEARSLRHARVCDGRRLQLRQLSDGRSTKQNTRTASLSVHRLQEIFQEKVRVPTLYPARR
jgi:hypothetical protein